MVFVDQWLPPNLKARKRTQILNHKFYIRRRSDSLDKILYVVCVYLSHLVVGQRCTCRVGGRKKRKQCEVYACGVDLRYQKGCFVTYIIAVTNYAPSRLIADGIHCTGRRKQMIKFPTKFVLIN